jgi:hypothetical protein
MSLSPDLLEQLAAAGLTVEQHRLEPHPDEWFVRIRGAAPGSTAVGVYESAEEAVVAGVRWLSQRADAADVGARRAEAALQAAQGELHDERIAQKQDGQARGASGGPQYHGDYTRSPLDAHALWVLLRRTGIFVAEHEGEWRWMVQPVGELELPPAQWNGPYRNASAALEAALRHAVEGGGSM